MVVVAIEGLIVDGREVEAVDFQIAGLAGLGGYLVEQLAGQLQFLAA